MGCLICNRTRTTLSRKREKKKKKKEGRKRVGCGNWLSSEEREMDDYTREMMDLKRLVTRTLEKKGVLARIRAELRASVFEAIEKEDHVMEKDQGLPPALLGSYNDRAKQLHASPPGRLLTAMICDYLDWAQLNHTLKVYLPECNLEKDFWKTELKEFSAKNGYDLNRNRDSPLLLDVLEGFLKLENLTQARASSRRYTTSKTESLPNSESHNSCRHSSSSVGSGLPPLGRVVPSSQASSDKEEDIPCLLIRRMSTIGEWQWWTR